MNSSNSILSHIKKKVDTLHNKVHFYIKESQVVQYHNADGSHNLQDIRFDDNAAIYLGKIGQYDNGIYSDENIVGMLEFAHQRHNKQEKLHIILGPELYMALAGEKGKSFYSNFTQGEKHIKTLAKEAKIPLQTIEIESLYSHHKDLFTALQNNDFFANMNSGYRRWNKETTSLDIARYLFGLTEKYPVLKEKFFSTVPNELKKILAPNHPLWYYGMIEISCRILDLSRGITLQGGMIRQEKYDRILLALLDTANIESMPEIADIQNRLQETNNSGLSRRYFKNKSYKDLLPQEIEKKGFIKKWKRNAAIYSLALAGVLTGGAAINNYVERKVGEAKHDAEQKAEIEYAKKYLGDKKIGVGFHYMMNYDSYKTPEEKATLLKNTTDNVYSYFSGLFDTKEEYKSAIKGLIKQELLDTSHYGGLNINDVNRDIEQGSSNAYSFIYTQFIPKNQKVLEAYGCDLTAYSSFLEYKDVISSTLEVTGDIEAKFSHGGQYGIEQKTDVKTNSTSASGHAFMFKIYNFKDANNMEYEVTVIDWTIATPELISAPSKRYILARYTGINDNYFTLQDGKHVCNEIMKARDREKRYRK